MAVGFGLVVLAFGALLFYKGWKGWSWNQLWGGIFAGTTAVPATKKGG